ncbi:MAG TPA: YkgJ family cysteine cluster protein [Candidatus Baltobacteraceae bacterium]
MNPEVAALYARIPKIECRQKCQDFCGAIIQLGAFTEAERPEIEHVAHAAQVDRAPDASPLACSALDRNGRCTIYAERPAICRFFGVVEGMTCPHGCEPERLLSHAEMSEILNALAAIAGPGRFAAAKKTLASATREDLIKHISESLLRGSDL